MLAKRFKLTCFKDWQLNAIQVVVRGEDALGNIESKGNYTVASWLAACCHTDSGKGL